MKWPTDIAHEINQPLAAIAMYSAAGLRTLQGGSDHGQVNAWLDAINTQAKRASEIVRRVRSFVQNREPQFGPVDLNLIAREVAALIYHEAGAQSVEIVLELAEDLPSAQGERILLEQVVFNLTRNALDALLAQSGVRRVKLKLLVGLHLRRAVRARSGLARRSSESPAPILDHHLLADFDIHYKL